LLDFLELTFFASHAKKVTKKDHRFLNFSRKSEFIFPPDSGNSACEKTVLKQPRIVAQIPAEKNFDFLR
jgi:hypothetical protein